MHADLVRAAGHGARVDDRSVCDGVVPRELKDGGTGLAVRVDGVEGQFKGGDVDGLVAFGNPAI